MTDAEKAAMVWLNQALRGDSLEFSRRSQHAATLLDMLAEPRLPAEPDKEMIGVMYRAWHEAGGDGATIATAMYRALYAHLTAPKTKTVEVWRVENAHAATGKPFAEVFLTQAEAADHAEAIRKEGCWACIHVTGPHTQEVPA